MPKYLILRRGPPAATARSTGALLPRRLSALLLHPVYADADAAGDARGVALEDVIAPLDAPGDLPTGGAAHAWAVGFILFTPRE